VAYTNRADNVAQDGAGNLALTVRRETYTMSGVTRDYTSGRVNSAGRREFAAPARFEARIRVPTDAGLVPAFWTLGASYGPWGSGVFAWPDCGEVDIFEFANNGFRPKYHLHGPDAGGALDRTPNRDVSLGGSHTSVDDAAGGFHVYGADFYPDHIDFRYDGMTRWTVTRSQYEAAGGRWANVFDQSQYMILNIGSLYSWVGSPSFTGSRTMLVDWVRVSRL
jgi:beta-glucanase (GH16 family)